jgi:hypothetical protein
MAKARVRAVSDAELLDGDDDETVDTTTDSNLEAINTGLDDLDEPAPTDGTAVVDQSADDIEVEIVQDDASGGVVLKDDEDDEAGGERIQDTDDTGEELGEDGLTEWEKKNYSKAMQGRVSRERRLKREEAARADTAEARARKAEAGQHEARKMAADLALQLTERDISAKEAQLLEAKEGGKSADEIKLQGELDDLRAKKRGIESTVHRLEQEQPAAADAPAANPVIERWKGRNRWYGNAKFAAEVGYTTQIDRALAGEHKAGAFMHAPGTVEYFNELDRRIHKAMPTLRTRIKQEFGGGGSAARPGDRRPAARAIVAPVSRGAPARSVGARKVQLNSTDLKNMTDFGLDTKNPAHLKEYALQKQGGTRG